MFIQRFEEEGYVVLEKLLDRETDLQPIIEHYVHFLDELCLRLFHEGKLSNTYSNLPFDQRLVATLNEIGGSFFQHMEISLPQNGIHHKTPIHHPPAVFNLLKHPKLLDVVEKFLGPEIYSNPVQHIRIKPPQRLLPKNDHANALISRTFWHQDQGVVLEEADATRVLTVWLPLTDVTEDNGCLVVVPGSHKQGLALHCKSPGANQIPDRFIGSFRKPLPMQAGDVLFMNKLTIHSSLPNVSDRIRWSFDLRYNPAGKATGRPWFPGFIARSRSNPTSELQDPEVWAESWRQARNQLAKYKSPQFQRWTDGDPRCA